jgi:1-deoxy-D-xylulose-5-phosphate synthase
MGDREVVKNRILDNIDSPKDLKTLSYIELLQLSKELREELISVLSTNGGHLAPNLGVVELTIALHLAFDSPKDQIIWDVGHQSYVHKILTGRRHAFSTLRQLGGISGFTKRQESPHDPFGAGHSSTSISAALGLAKARDLLGEDNSVIAVIGDGSMTGGMAYEALNYAGHIKSDVIVVLNDNEMSIAPNVGAMAAYLARVRTDPTLQKVQSELQQALERLPAIGKTMARAVERGKGSLKYLVVPGMLFEELGFTYFGPIDGHNIWAMSQAFQDAKKRGGPVLVHVITKKGKGYPPAEKDPERFHGVGPFSIESGESISEPDLPSYTQYFSKFMLRLGDEDPKVVGITAAMSDGTGLDKFAQAYPDRFIDVGIAEQNAVTLAAGLAAKGFRPVVSIYSTFLQRSYDQIVHDVCLQKLPVTFMADRAGLVGEDGPTHHGVFDIAYTRHIPNMVAMAPKDENELQHMLYTAVSLDGPAIIRYPRDSATGTQLDPEPKPLELGRAEVLMEGNDLAILALGTMVYPALRAGMELRRNGIEPMVVNARFVKPLDEELIEQLARNIKRLLIVEEHSLQGGFGSAVLEFLESKEILEGVKLKRIGIPDSFIEHGPRKALLKMCGLTSDGIIQGAFHLLKGAHSEKKVGRG